MSDIGDIKSIIEKAKLGDTEAAGKLYEAHRSKGLAIARKYVRNQDDAEDMYQDAFLKALTNIDKFDESKQFGPWLDTIIVNTCKNFLVKKKAVNFSDMSDEENEFVDTIDSKDLEAMPELSYDRKEFMEIMDSLINELPQAQREVVALYYYKEMSIKQIAELQEVPEDTVKSRLNYSRKKVGAAVEEYEKKTGVKLYGALLVPLMYVMFFRKSVYAAEADVLLSSSSDAVAKAARSAGRASERAAKKAARKAARAAAGEVTKKAVASTALKIAVPVAAAAVLGTTAFTVLKPKITAPEPVPLEQTDGSGQVDRPDIQSEEETKPQEGAMTDGQGDEAANNDSANTEERPEEGKIHLEEGVEGSTAVEEFNRAGGSAHLFTGEGHIRDLVPTGDGRYKIVFSDYMIRANGNDLDPKLLEEYGLEEGWYGPEPQEGIRYDGIRIRYIDGALYSFSIDGEVTVRGGSDGSEGGGITIKELYEKGLGSYSFSEDDPLFLIRFDDDGIIGIDEDTDTNTPHFYEKVVE